jgi:quercetin dioxygenase-like cupin family protein
MRMSRTIVRKALLAAAVGERTISNVDVREITLGAGQKSGRHLHPCPVIGYIVSGTAELEIEGQPPQPLPAGAAFYEPAETVIARFDNASATEPMTFIACYLLRASEPLIQML